MSFAIPFFFWGLVSLIPLIAIYFLKVRPIRKPTTAWFLWEDIFQERRARTLFQRFRDLFSLLLLALAFAAVVTATAQPFWTGDDRKDLVLLIDNSASMNANENGQTRLERAKQVAGNIVRALNGTQRCSVATVSGSISFQSNLTDNPKELLDAINGIEPSSIPLSLSTLEPFTKPLTLSITDGSAFLPAGTDAMDTGETPIATVPGEPGALHRVILVSDGCLAGQLPASIELLKVGGLPQQKNVGLIACDMQRLPASGGRAGVFFQIASTFDEPLYLDLSVCHGTPDNLVKLIPLEISPGINRAEVFEIDRAADGEWLIRLDVNDSLTDDNTAFVVLPPQVPIEVSVAADNRFFYENSVLAFSRSGNLLQLGDSASAQLIIGQGNVLLDGIAPDADLLLFQPEGKSPWWNDVGEDFAPAIPRALDENHPVIRHLDATSIPFVGAKRMTAPAGSEVWVVAEDETPLIYRTTDSGRNVVVVNLDPLAAEFFLSPWFPVLVYSTATHLAGRAEPVRSTYATGHAVPIQGFQVGESAEWTGPDGKVTTSGEAFSKPLQNTGFHTFKNTAGTWTIGCSLISETETMLDNSKVQDTAQPVSRGWSPTGLLTLLAIVVVVLESILYQRRMVG